MICSPFDLRDYILDELAEPERRQVEQHARSCAACREEMERLRATRAALSSLPDEEIPQRIAFVSDPVFEPSPLRRFWRTFWGSAARLGFASAAMLSAAIVYTAATRPAPAPAPAPALAVNLAELEARFQARTEAAVRQAEARQEEKTRQLLAASEERHRLEMKSIELAVDQELTLMQKRFNQVRMTLASSEFGAPR
ncbi:MAG: zf-HC2 domain-containing protein [Bryobacteraceae bacterium]